MEPQTVTIKNVAARDRSKAGVVFKDKNGKQRYNISFQCEEMQGKWISGFSYDANELEVGKQYNLVIEQNGNWLNYSFPRKPSLQQQMEELGNSFIVLEARVATLEMNVLPPSYVPSKETE